ncbi:tetratricopeptide repeat protein [Endozoicomonadaceae bacterium StTr2]
MADYSTHKITKSLSIMILGLILLQGCTGSFQNIQQHAPQSVDNSGPEPAASNEILLQAAQNHAGLIALYKSRLQGSQSQSERDEIYLKLVTIYLETHDTESAQFYLSQVSALGNDTAKALLLYSRTYQLNDKTGQALEAALKARELQPDNPDINNQLGLLYAEQNNYSMARQYFSQARINMLDDAAVKNNLAVLDILEQNYESAAQRLLPLYSSGQADERIRANLLIALAKGGMYSEFRRVYGDSASERENVELFRALIDANPSKASNAISLTDQ